MTDVLHYIGLPFDESRPPSAADDLTRLAEALRANGFTVSEPDDRTVEVWRDDFGARVTLEQDWMVQILSDILLTDVVRDEEAGLRGIDRLARLIGAVGQVADTYLGFVSNKGEDLSFVGDERPVEITEPLSLMYFGRRYLDDWGTPPEFGAEFTVTVLGGQVVVPVLADLG